MRRLTGVIAIWLVAAGLATAEEKATRRSYYYFSRSSLPVGTATIAPERETSKQVKPGPTVEEKARQASWERLDSLAAEPLGPVPPVFAEEEFPLGVRVDHPLTGVRSGYEYAGRRYSAHCLTAPGYEGACWPVCPPGRQYRLKVRPPGLFSCLLGCHDFRYKWVPVRPRWRDECLSYRARAWRGRGWADASLLTPGPLETELAWSEPAAVWSPGRVYGVSPAWTPADRWADLPAAAVPPLGLASPELPPDLDLDGGPAAEIPVPLLTPPSP